MTEQEQLNLTELKCIISDETGQLLKLPFCNYEKNMTLIRCLLYAKKANKVLVGTNHGLYICNPITFEMENALNPASTDGWFYDKINSTDSFFLFERKDGTILTSARNNKMKIYDLFKLECIKEIIINSGYFPMITDGNELTNGNLVIAFNKSILIYDGKSYELKQNINEYKGIVHAICSMKNNKFVTASYDDSRLIFWKNDSNNFIKDHCINDIKVSFFKQIIFDEEKNIIIVGFSNNILIIDGDKYNFIKKIIVDEISYVKSLLLLDKGSFIVASGNWEIFEYDNQYNLHSQIKNDKELYYPLMNKITDILYCNKCLLIASNGHSIKVYKKSNEDLKISKYNRIDYDSD